MEIHNQIQTAHICRDWTTAMHAQALSLKTIEERVRITQRICEAQDRSPLSLTTSEIVEWISVQPSAETKWTYFTHLRALFRWLEITGKRKKNPLLGMRAPKRPKYRPRPIAAEHIARVLAGGLRKTTRCMIVLAFNCGLRVSEIAKARGQDFDLVAKQFTVEGKGGQLSLLPINDGLIPLFETMPRSGYWFPSPGGGHVRPASVGATIQRAFAKHGISMTAHQLRHAYGTELLRHGADIRVVQELLRHESIQTTALYTRVAHNQEAEATNLLPVFTTTDSNPPTSANRNPS
ncbi:tyrosine-type recombinase/integrase [Trueperella pyogenes]|uniref:tyrosine-type recombinase/integrase n=1 Tax=Trueperella pyogenes TaxID=1661 RepID=UPI00345DF8A7